MNSTSSSDGGFIHRFVPGVGTKVLLLLHGTGGNEDSLLSFGRELDPDASLLSVRGKVLENGMPRFFRRFAEGVFDVEDLKHRAGELADFVEWAAGKYGFREGSIASVGYSNGANIAAGMLFVRPESMSSAVLFRATLPYNPDPLPTLWTKSAFISAGRFDPLVPKEGTLALADVLRKAGAAVTLNWEDSTHSLRQDELEKARSWLAA